MFNYFYAAIIGVLLFLSTGLFAENMLKNGTLDDADTHNFSPTGLASTYKYSMFTEDLTWNRCVRLDVMNFEKALSIGVVIGGAKGGDAQDGRNALTVLPNTTYKFSIDLKGTVKNVGIAAFVYDGECNGSKERKRVKTSIGGINVQPNWMRYEGEFTTGSNTKKAALYIQIWCDEKQGGIAEKPGTYLLIDNVIIEEKKGTILEQPKTSAIKIDKKQVVCVPFTEHTPSFDGKETNLWNSATEITNFVIADDINSATVKTSAKLLATPEALWIMVKCTEPKMDKIKAVFDKDGMPLWTDDCVELFFDTVTDATLRQFVVNSLGKRMMTWVNKSVQPSKTEYEKWEAKSFKNNDIWIVQVKLPYEVLGFKTRPESGFSIPFNLTRERYAEKPELSSWSKVSGNFSRKEKYGILVFGNLKDYLGKRLALVKNEILKIPSDIPAEKKNQKEDILRRLQKWENVENVSTETVEDAYIDTEKAIKEACFLILSNRKFAVTQVPVTDDFKVPYMPGNITADSSDGIKCRTAINEFKSLPIALTNLTDRTESYRVILFAKEDSGGIEKLGLSGLNGNDFPIEAISIKEAVRFKDSDALIHGQRFDPLPEINQAYTVTVPPKESGLVWITFNCTDRKPDMYSGILRIIPLDQPGKFVLGKGGWEYEGQMKDIPFKLEIMPIELSKEPIIPLWLMTSAANENFFRDMIEHGNRVFQLSPYGFKTTFNPDGSIKSVDHEGIDKIIKNHLEWAKKYNVKIKFFVGWDCSPIFNDVIAKKAFAYKSPEWEKAWSAWLNSMQETFKKNNIAEKDYVLELFDEPKNYDEAIYWYKKAKETCPSLRFTVTLGSPLWTEEKINRILPFLDDITLWDSYFGRKEFESVISRLQCSGKTFAYYTCHVGDILMPVYSYYRLFAWKGYLRKVDTIGLFKYVAGPGGYYGRRSWKCEPFGSLIYNSLNIPVTSIRYEVLRTGMDDTKYLQKLDELLKIAKQKKIESEKLDQASKMLKEIPYEVIIVNSHKNDYAEQARAKLANMIISVQHEIYKDNIPQ